MKDDKDDEANPDPNEPRMVRPRITLVDLPSTAVESLRREGFFVSTGTMGSRYSASPEDIQPAVFDQDLHALADQDVVVVDASRPSISIPNHERFSKSHRRAIERVTVVARGQDYFDPRPAAGAELRSQFETLLMNGGILIVFCASEYTELYHSYEILHGRVRDSSRKQFSASNLRFLPFQASMPDSGARIEVVVPKLEGEFERLRRVLERHKHAFRPESTWFVPRHVGYENILEDRFGEPLGVLVQVQAGGTAPGLALLLPPTVEPGQLLVSLTYEALAPMRPDKFPDIANAAWMDAQDYLPPTVVRLLEEKKALQWETSQKLQDVDGRIELERQRYDYLFRLIGPAGTGDRLVEDLVHVFGAFGYGDVAVPDDERSTGFEEDLQVRSGDLVLVVEAKGLTRCPTDSDCGQVTKYVGRRLKEGVRAHGLFVVNHERNRPPLERTEPAFTEAQVGDALGTELYSLVTTWQLFRAFQAFEAGELAFEDIDCALRTPGVVTFLPRGWQQIGVVEHVFPKAGAVRLALTDKVVRKGDVLGFVHDARYSRVVVQSVEVGRESVQVGRPGEQVAVKVTPLPPKGSVIYLESTASD